MRKRIDNNVYGAWTGMAGALVAVCALAGSAHAHATYNTAGYGSGVGGSTNGVDGMPAASPPATWTNGGVLDYVGTLPATWYCGMHSTPSTRIIQTGLAPAAPSGSFLQQVGSYNTSTDPDLPTDMVLAVGGKSWSDPDNANQGWGHGLDYGLIHISPLDTLLAGGPLKLVITLTDDASDGVATRLAYAIYGGWDSGASSDRHQTFTTSPAPVDNPLGSTGLTLIDSVAASSAGATIARSYDVDPAYDGEYTILIGAQGGVSGQYSLTVGVYTDSALASCEDSLLDTDEDTVLDSTDLCAATALGADVDQDGCSRAEFCAAFDASTPAGKKGCTKADWKNDQPLGAKAPERDCVLEKDAGPPKTLTCVARP
jgi:hypothetical protein